MNKMERKVDTDAKKKHYQHELMAFLTADLQLDQAEGLVHNLCQPTNHIPADDNPMEGKASEYELKDGLALNCKPESSN
jgi:hypothetical protein